MNLSRIDSRPMLSTQQKTGPSGRFWVLRAEDEIRTRDLLLGKETLYRAEPLPRRWGYCSDLDRCLQPALSAAFAAAETGRAQVLGHALQLVPMQLYQLPQQVQATLR